VKAVRIHEFEGPAGLRLDEIELKEPGPGEVCLQVRACGLNHLDVDVCRGVSRFPLELPMVPGFEVVGEIATVGPGVAEWQPGDRVAAKVMDTCGRCLYCETGRESLCDSPRWVSFAYSGGYSEALVCSADQLIRVPDGLGDEEAAALQVAFATAWHMLFTRGRLVAGETVLVNAVGSGIGSAAVQLATWAGARVIGTAGSDAKLARATSFGLAEGINYEKYGRRFSSKVLDLTAGRGVDLVFEHVGGDVLNESIGALRKGGRLVTCGAHSGEIVPFDVIPFFRAEKELIGSFVFGRREVEKVFELAHLGVVTPIIDTVYPLEQAAEAMRRMESRDAFGKIVLKPGHEAVAVD
jgi:2-desacetyl-2-hydroxyethyl bacteriochlorophyllide A dehydrogenase